MLAAATLIACGGGEAALPKRASPSAPPYAAPVPNASSAVDAGASPTALAPPPAFDWEHAAHALDGDLAAPLSAELLGAGDRFAMVRFTVRAQTNERGEAAFDGLVDLTTGCVTETQDPKDQNGDDADFPLGVGGLNREVDIVGAFTSSPFHTMIEQRLSWLVQMKVMKQWLSTFHGSSERAAGISDDRRAVFVAFDDRLYISNDGGRTFRRPDIDVHLDKFRQGNIFTVLYFVPGTHLVAYTVTPSPGPTFSGLHAYTLDVDAPESVAKPRLEVTTQDYADRVYMNDGVGIYGNRADRCFYNFTIGANGSDRTPGWCVPGKSPGSFPYFQPPLSPNGKYGVNIDEDHGKVTSLYFRTDGSEGGAHPLPGKVDAKNHGRGPDDFGHYAWPRGPLGHRVEGPDGIFDLETTDPFLGFGTNGNMIFFHAPSTAGKLPDVKCTLVRSVDPKREGTPAHP